MKWIKYKYYRFLWWLTENFDYTHKHPLHVDIELTNQCNLACIMCPHGDENWNPKKGMMDKQTAIRLINQCVTIGVFSIKLQFRGESALHKDLVEIIKYAKARGVLEVQLNTNGIPFTHKKVKGMILAGLDKLIVSVDGATPETYAAIRVGGELEKVRLTLGSFRHLKKVLGSKKPFIRLQMTQQELNKKEAKQLRKEWGTLANEINIKPVRASNTGERKPCPQPRQRLIFGWNMQSFGCCNAWNGESQIGDGRRGIKHLWSNAAMKELRKKAEYCTLEPCKSCQVRASYL